MVTFTQTPARASVVASSHNQTHTITITADDGHGNTTVHTVVLTARDETPPAITAPASINVNTDNGQCSATNVSLGAAAFSDNCAGTTLSNDAPPVYPKGNTTVTWTATDAAGNKTTATQTVTITDREKPVLTCPVVPVQCYVSSGSYNVPALTATDNCGSTSITYAVTGSTGRNGSGSNASGNFNEGTSTITWTVIDGSGNISSCSTIVVINPRLIVSLPDVYAVSPGGAANTIYKGYGPTSLTLNANVSGGSAPYSFKWTAGTSSGQVLSSTSSLTVNPTTSTTYYFNVKDKYGCSATLFTRTIEVVDVRCGPKKDKVTVCVMQKGVPTTSCVTPNSVQSYLGGGGYLGACVVYTATANIRQTQTVSEPVTDALSVTASPNPSTSHFRLDVAGRQGSEITIRIFNTLGTVMETRKVAGGKFTVQLGANYRPGMYYAEVVQDGEKVMQKLVKL
jgi:hypothetical protein